MLLAALVFAFLVSQISPAWTGRYFAALVGPAIVLAGAMLARAGTMGLVTAALVAGLWLHPPTRAINNKSDVHHISILVRDQLRPGDLVVSTHPEQVPVLHFYFPPGLRWASGMGWVRDTGIMDWRDALDRYRKTWPHPTATRFIAALRPGQQLVLVLPIVRTAGWGAPWTRLVKNRSLRWEYVLDHAPRLRREQAIPHFGRRKLPKGVRVVLYRRV
jgi:mannosyltransferase